MFPLDDIFVFGDIFFSWLIFFFLAFAIGFKFAGVRRRHCEEPAGPEGLLAVPPTNPGKCETDGESQQKKILSQDKKKYSPTNENTHPTETPICL